MSKTWFITGASRGFGKEFAHAALGRGDKVAATARKTADLNDLVREFGAAVLPLQLDVTDRASAFAAVEATTGQFGGLDVVVNNAGYGLFGMVEELTEQQLRDQLEVNLFGVFHVTQAVLPVLRAQGSGHIIQISTVGGIAAFPTLGGYHASKWALEGLTESLAQEVAGFDIKVTLIEPGGYGTDWAGSSAAHADHIDAYQPVRDAVNEQMAEHTTPEMIGEPVAAGRALLSVVDAETAPLRVLFGLAPTVIVPPLYQRRLDEWEQWKAVSLAANGH
jgi:NAD(P)-dependent dehydrogenase (short-subunit alcohol dehydrogenase family)